MARRHRALLAAVLLPCLVLALAGCLFGSLDTEVTIDDGTVQGTVDGEVASWLGIPYAAPPVGDLRWRAPEPPAPWPGERAADEFQQQCLQTKGGAVAEGSSEDCLYLNVFRPDSDEEDLPVMVWLHGGGLVMGSGDLPLELVSGLVEHDVVVVSVNYRLGRLGYFAHPALAEEGGAQGPVANFGLLDQVAALQWVRDNIAEFGGDPEAVTVFGISAGGASVNYLMSSPAARGLFDRAISGSGLGRERPTPWLQAAAAGERLAAGSGAPGADAAALRAVEATTVASWPAYQLRGEVPIIDRVLPRSVADTFAAGDEAQVPYVAGTTDVELLDRSFRVLGVDPEARRAQVVAGRQTEAATVYRSATEFQQHFLNDVYFTEPARHLTAQHADRAPTYRYLFRIASEEMLSTFGGAVHGADYPYVFGAEAGVRGVANAEELGEEVSTCWASFAKDVVPSCGAVTWPEVGQGLMQFTNEGPVATAEDPQEGRLDFVERLYERAAAAAGS